MAGQLVVSMPPLKRRVPGTASVPVAPAVPAAAPALRAELQTLRRAELRLDAALRPEEVVVAGRRGPPRPVPQMAPRQEIQGSFLRSHPSSGFVFDLDLKRFFIAWADICKEMRAYWRRRRDENSRKWLGNRSSAVALWSFFASLKRYLDQPLPQKPQRGMRVREKTTQIPGTFFSSSDKGVCKVLLDGEGQQVCFRHCDELQEIAALPHPFLARLAFLAWTLSHAQHEDLKIDGLRTALMFNQIMGKSSGKLTMLAVMQEEESKGLKFCFNAWKKAMKSKSLKKFRLKKQREIFRAWLEILLMDKHDRALELLDARDLELRGASAALQRRIEQCERVKVKVEKVHLWRLDFFLQLVLQSWRMSCTYRKAHEEQSREARKALALSALQLSEAMGKRSVRDVMPQFQAWAARVKHGKRLKRAAESTISALLGGSLSLVFNAWKMMKMSEFQTLQAQLNRRDREFNELQEISQGFFSLSQENVERLKNMEAALQAADRALQIGAARGDSLEVEVRKLQHALKHQAEDAGTRGEQLREDLERRCGEEMEALAEGTEKVKAELQASREMEARLQRVWHDTQSGDAQDDRSSVVVALRQQLASALADAEQLRTLQRSQAEQLKSAESLEHSEANACRAAGEALRLAQEAALEAEELAKIEELTAEAAMERLRLQTSMMSPHPAASVAPEQPWSPAAASSAAVGTSPVTTVATVAPVAPLGPGISTQTSMPPLEDGERERRYRDAWRPRGRNLIDTTNDAMTFGLACNILSTGAYFKKKAGRRSSVKRYFFVGYGTSSTGFLKYFKDHSAASGATTPRGSFDLMDLVRANWDGLQHSITLTQSTKKDSTERGLVEIPETFFHALLVAVHEAEFLRQFPEYGRG